MTTQTQDASASFFLPKLLNQAWLDPRVALVAAISLAVLAGLLTATTMPHGPATASQALIVMASCLAVGLIAGWLMRTRWAILVAPVAYMIAIELTRLGLAGASVGALRFDNAYGILAFVVGRGFHALVGLLPMMYGAGLGVLLALPAARPGSMIAWAPTALLGTGLLALGVLIALPASTPAILDGAGKPVPGSIASLEKVRLGGSDQWIMIRAHSADKPVLLYLSGGPGQSDLPFSRVLFADLSRDFVMVSWDQRGTGKSYASLDPLSALTLDQAVRDTIELSQYLRERFAERKIYMMGESWGSILGVLAVQQRPDLYHAWIGSGQMVSLRETDLRAYQDVLDLAARTGDEATASRMLQYGKPPYADTPYANAFVMGLYEPLYKPYTPPQAYRDLGNAANIGPYGIFGAEYNFVEKANVLRGLIDTFTVMYPQLQGIDFRRDAPKLDVPVYILDGQAELSSRRSLALEWYALLGAPIKRTLSFEDAAHSVAFEQFEAFHAFMLSTVLPETYAAVP